MNTGAVTRIDASSAGTPTSAKRRARVCLCAAASAVMSTPPFVRSNAPYT